MIIGLSGKSTTTKESEKCPCTKKRKCEYHSKKTKER